MIGAAGLYCSDEVEQSGADCRQGKDQHEDPASSNILQISQLVSNEKVRSYDEAGEELYEPVLLQPDTKRYGTSYGHCNVELQSYLRLFLTCIRGLR